MGHLQKSRHRHLNHPANFSTAVHYPVCSNYRSTANHVHRVKTDCDPSDWYDQEFKNFSVQAELIVKLPQTLACHAVAVGTPFHCSTHSHIYIHPATIH